MQATSAGEGDRNYMVAETLDGKVTGVMGLAPIGKGLRQYGETERPVEVVNAFVTDSERGRGAGRALLSRLEELAAQQGFTELVVTSGPRYKEKGWPFWTKVFGPAIAIVKDAFGPGNDAPVWRKQLI